jgi:hypothetical protein
MEFMKAGGEEGLRLRPAKTKTLFLLAVSLTFTVAGIHAIATKRAFAGWLVLLFFAVCSAVFAIHLLPGASYLELLPEGFIACSLFRRRPLVRWDSVSVFRVERAPGTGIKLVVFSQTIPNYPRLAAINQRLVGDTDALPDTYGRNAEQLALLMNEWRRRGKIAIEQTTSC